MTQEKALQGDKVILRPKSVEDTEDDYRWRVDEELSRLDAAPPLRMSYEEFRSMAESELRYPVAWTRRFAIVDPVRQLHIGNCMYYDIDYARKQTELGILVGERDYWSHGYGTDAVMTMLRHIFEETPITKVYLHTLDWNVRAQKSFAKCGFVFVKKVRRDGQWFHYMEVTKDAWLQVPGGQAPPSRP